MGTGDDIMLHRAQPGDTSYPAQDMNKIVDAAEWVGRINEVFDPQFFRVSGGLISFNGFPDVFPFDTRYLFSLTIAGTDVTIGAGEIHYGKYIISTSETTKTIANDNSYIAVKMALNQNSTATIEYEATKPVSTNTHFFKWLYQFRLISGQVSLADPSGIGHAGGAITIPGVAAPV